MAFSTGQWGWRWCNVAFVLLLPHQLGHAYADGTFARWPRRRYWAMVVGGLACLIVLTTPWVFRLFGDVRFDWFPGIGHYPKSLLGTDVEDVSNAYPPTVCFLLGGVWTIGAVMLLKPRLDRWLQRERPWRFTIVVNARIMTLFLWHMTAFLLALLLLWPLGFGREQDSTARWWLERPLWFLAAGVDPARAHRRLRTLRARAEARGARGHPRSTRQRTRSRDGSPRRGSIARWTSPRSPRAPAHGSSCS